MGQDKASWLQRCHKAPLVGRRQQPQCSDPLPPSGLPFGLLSPKFPPGIKPPPTERRYVTFSATFYLTPLSKASLGAGEGKPTAFAHGACSSSAAVAGGAGRCAGAAESKLSASSKANPLGLVPRQPAPCSCRANRLPAAGGAGSFRPPVSWLPPRVAAVPCWAGWPAVLVRLRRDGDGCCCGRRRTAALCGWRLPAAPQQSLGPAGR